MCSFCQRKNLDALILKMDLVKACDRVNWVYLRLILHQIGLSVEVTNWILACVTTTNFSVLVNGSPSNFFQGSRGIIQGFPLYPLLFLIVIGGFQVI